MNKGKWYEEQEEKFKNRMRKQSEDLFYAAEEGSYLDRIWKGQQAELRKLEREISEKIALEVEEWLKEVIYQEFGWWSRLLFRINPKLVRKRIDILFDPNMRYGISVDGKNIWMEQKLPLPKD